MSAPRNPRSESPPTGLATDNLHSHKPDQGPAPARADSLTDADFTLSPAAREAVARGVPDSTRRAYAKEVEDFQDWCATVGRSSLPATAETLAEYATHLTQLPKSRSPGGIERARSAIRTTHRTAGLTPPESIGLAKVVTGYRAQLAEARDPKARPRKATAALKQDLEAMVAQCDDSPIGIRDKALILLGFAFAGRRSETAEVDIGHLEESDDGITVSVYRRKTKRWHEAAIRWSDDPSLCPVIATMRLLDLLRTHGRTTGPLFVRIDRHGRIGAGLNRHGQPIGNPDGRMTPQAVNDVITRRAKAAGLQGRFTGHSTRRGFATEARRAGHDRLRIARQGDWQDNSTVLAGYMEDVDRWDDNPLKGVL